jgi:hypothetical protein
MQKIFVKNFSQSGKWKYFEKFKQIFDRAASYKIILYFWHNFKKRVLLKAILCKNATGAAKKLGNWNCLWHVKKTPDLSSFCGFLLWLVCTVARRITSLFMSQLVKLVSCSNKEIRVRGWNFLFKEDDFVI